MKSMTTLLIAILLAAPPPAKTKDPQTSAAVDAPDSEREKVEAAERLVFMKKSLQDYEFRSEAKGPAIVLQLEPLLRWNNPVSGVRDGTVFIWTAAGRPQAAVQVFQLKSGVWLHEFQSLATDRFEAKLAKGSPVWTPARAGIEMKRAPDAPAPAENERQRLPQMRAIAEEYQAIDDFEAQKSRWHAMPFPTREFWTAHCLPSRTAPIPRSFCSSKRSAPTPGPNGESVSLP